MTAVPCAGCTLCCKKMVVEMKPEDDALSYKTEPYLGGFMLAHKPNGDCAYLEEKGCSIHDRAPSVCRKMDCRVTARKLTFKSAVNLAVVEIWHRGRELNAVNQGERNEDHQKA